MENSKYYSATIVDKLSKECFENNVTHRMLNMMEDKYYTPTIEEFHVGFEYYVDNKLYIITDVVLKLMLNAITEDTFEGKYGQGTLRLNIDNVRVKYLDQEDIESLGWEHDYNLEPIPNRENDSVFYGYILEQDGGETQYLLFHFNDGEVWIEKIINCAGQGNIFKGQLKNKSELKRVLKQVGVL